MGRRRGETDALLPVKEPRWRVVRDGFSRVIESQALGPQTDLRAVMQAERGSTAPRRARAGGGPAQLRVLLLSSAARVGGALDGMLGAGAGRFGTMLDAAMRSERG